MGHGRRDGAQTDPLDDAEVACKLDCPAGHRLPAVVGLRTGQDEHVVAVRSAQVADRQLGPGQRARPAVVDGEDRAPGAIVEELVGVEGRDRGRIHVQQAGRGRGCAAGVDPAVEGDDEGRRHQVGRAGQSVERHRRGGWRRDRSGWGTARIGGIIDRIGEGRRSSPSIARRTCRRPTRRPSTVSTPWLRAVVHGGLLARDSPIGGGPLARDGPVGGGPLARDGPVGGGPLARRPAKCPSAGCKLGCRV